MPPTSCAATARHGPTLIGRERERRILDDAFAAALNGSGGLTFIGGEAGIGKTALAGATCRATSSALVLVGHCYELTETPPYGLWVDLFSHYQAADDQPMLPAAFAQRGTVAEATSQAALFQQVKDFFDALATPRSGGGRPLVILLEDLHWADPASLDLLRFLGRALTASATLLLATYRNDELTPGHSFAQLLPAVIRESRATCLELKRLEISDIHMLVTSRYDLSVADQERLVTHLYERAEGNPFFTGEILRTLEEGRVVRPTETGWRVGDLARARVPSLVRQVIEDRLARLDGERRRHLAMAAVIGNEVSLAHWASVAEEQDDALLPTIERAVAAHLMEETPGGTGLRFVHALIRESLYEQTPLPMRRACHRRMAVALSSSPIPDPNTIAYHFQRAGDTRAVEWLIRAGERAERAFAWVTAIKRYRAALDLMERDETDTSECVRLLCLLGLLHRYSDPKRGVSYLEEATKLATLTADPVFEAMTLFYQGHLRTLAGDWIRGIDEYGVGIAALDALAPADQERFQAMIADGRMAREHNPWATYAVGLVQVGRYVEAKAVIARLLTDEAQREAPGSIHNANAYRALGEVYAALGQPEDARAAAAQARAFYQALDHQAMLGRTAMHELRWMVLAYQTERLEDRKHLAAEAERAWTVADGSMSEREFSPRCTRVSLLILDGEWEEADELSSTLLRIGFFADAFGFEIARLARWRGDAALAWQLVHNTMKEGAWTPPGKLHFRCGLELQRIAAALAVDAGDLEMAANWLEAHDRWLAWNHAVLGRAEGYLAWANWYRASGDWEHALEHTILALADASDPRQPPVLIAAHRFLGELETDLERFDTAEANLQTSLALANDCAAPYEQARTHYALALLAHACGERGKAERHLDRARTICTRLGARMLHSRVDALQAELGGQPAAMLPCGITPREIEVLRLAAQGLDNAAVSAQLFISTHTVHRHMANILMKLDLPTRTAAVAWALRHDLL